MLTLPSTVTCVPPRLAIPLDNSNGIVWDMAWLYRYTNGGLTVTPGIGVQWNSENQNEYYYGVSRKESARSGLRGYNPNDSWSPYTELSASYLPRRLECLRYRALHPSV